MSRILDPDAKVFVPKVQSLIVEKEAKRSLQYRYKSVDGPGVGQYLQFKDILNCRLVSKRWRDSVQIFGLMKSATLVVYYEEKAKMLLRSNLFKYVGTLVIAECDVNKHRKPFYDSFNKVLRSIHESEVLYLESLLIYGTKPNCEDLAKAICRIKEVKLNCENLTSKFYKIIAECETLVTESYTYVARIGNPAKVGFTDTKLFAEVAARMVTFKVSIDVRVAAAVLDKIHDSTNLKLQHLELNVWNWKSYYDYDHEHFFKNYSKSKFSAVESKLQKLVLNIKFTEPSNPHIDDDSDFTDKMKEELNRFYKYGIPFPDEALREKQQEDNFDRDLELLERNILKQMQDPEGYRKMVNDQVASNIERATNIMNMLF